MRLLNIFGLIIFSLGVLLLAGFGLFEFLEDLTVPSIVKWGIGALLLGVFIILLSLIIERSKDRKKEEQYDSNNDQPNTGQRS